MPLARVCHRMLTMVNKNLNTKNIPSDRHGHVVVRTKTAGDVSETQIPRPYFSHRDCERFGSGEKVSYFQLFKGMVYRAAVLCRARNFPVTLACGTNSRGEASSRNSLPQLWQVTNI